MDEARGVRPGLAVRDAAGNPLGEVRRVYPWGFEVGRGFWSPYQWVFRNEELLRLDGDVLVVARSPDDLQRLAAGGLPSSWRRGTPEAARDAGELPATPQEAKGPPKRT